MSEVQSAAPSRVRSLAEVVKVPDLSGEVKPEDSISNAGAPRRPKPEQRAPAVLATPVEEGRSEVSRHEPREERAPLEPTAPDARSHVSAARQATREEPDARSHASAARRPREEADARSHVSAARRPPEEADARSHVSAARRPREEPDARSHVSAARRPREEEADARSHVSVARQAPREEADARSHASAARQAPREEADARSHVSVARQAPREEADARAHASYAAVRRPAPEEDDARSHVSRHGSRADSRHEPAPARRDAEPASRHDPGSRRAPQDDARSAASAAPREADARPGTRAHDERTASDDDGFLRLDEDEMPAGLALPPPQMLLPTRHPYQGSTETHTTIGMARARSPVGR